MSSNISKEAKVILGTAWNCFMLLRLLRSFLGRVTWFVQNKSSL